MSMKPMIVDADKLEENIKHPFSKVSDEERMKSDIAEMILSSLVPYEEKKEIPSILYGNGCGGAKDHRCMKCNGVGGKEGEVLLHGFPYNYKRTCNHCNGTGVEPRKGEPKVECDCKEMSCSDDCTRKHTHKGFSCDICKEPRKEQDTRTHAWETKTYTQDEVRKMLEDLKMRDNLAGNSKEVQEDRKHMNAKIDKKIAEL